jgi:hypothetical protein
MASLIGALRVTLGADTARFEQGMKRSQRQAATSATAIQKSLGSIKTGFASLVAGIGLAQVTAVVGRALEYAASLGEVSQQLGVTTKDLQVFRYAATQTGLSQEEMDKALGKLTITLGQVAAGAAAPTKALKAIGITADELKNRDTGAAFRLIADGLQKVEDRSQRAAVEVALFGRTGAKLDTLLAGGSGSINELADAAERLGIVLSDEQIQRADETADKMAALKTVLEANIASAVADNANSILALVDALSQLIARIPDAINWYNRFRMTVGALQGRQQQLFGLTPGIRKQGVERQQAVSKEILQSMVGMALGAQGFVPASDPVSGANRGSIDGFLAGGGGKRGPRGKSAEQLAAEAERQRKEQLRDAYEFASDERRNQMDILQAQSDLAEDYVDRTNIELQILDLEKEQESAALAHAVAMGDLTQVQADRLAAQHAILDELKRQETLQQQEAQRAREFAELERLDLNLQRDQLESEAQLATTARERRAVELRILDAAYAEERLAIEQLKASKDWKDQEEGRRREAALRPRYENDRASVMQGTMGPLESYLNSIPDTAAEASEALEMVAARGLQSLEDGLVDVLTGTKSLAEGFRQMAASIIADLIRIQVQKMITFAMSAMSGGTGGSFSSVLGSFSSSSIGAAPLANLGDVGNIASLGILPKMARGGAFTIGGRPGVDQNLMSINGLPVARVGHGERVQVIPTGAANDSGRMLGGPTININAPMSEKQARMTGRQAAAAYQQEMASAKRRGF